ncbi:MAG: HDOD domain-containing protein [Acidobacteriota bacterium]
MGSFRDRAEWIAAEAEDIPTLHEVAWKVLKTVSDRPADVQDLERLVSRDQPLTAKILRIANSRWLGGRQPVSTLRQAITVLGTRRLRSLVLAASIDGVVRSRAMKNRHMWEHALAVAVASELLAEETHYPDRQEAFVCGLLHDLGKAVLEKSLASEYQQVLDRVYNEHIWAIEAERAILGFDHAAVGALVARKWNLPAVLEEVVREHHTPASATLDPYLCAIVSFADGLCVREGIGPSQRPEIDMSSLAAASILGMKPASLARTTQAVATRFQEDKRLFGLN